MHEGRICAIYALFNPKKLRSDVLNDSLSISIDNDSLSISIDQANFFLLRKIVSVLHWIWF